MLNSPKNIKPQATNPFTPIFGKVPAYFAGREQIIDDLVGAFSYDHMDPSLISLFVGPRGVGKTALLNYLSSVAQQQGWIVANVTSIKGMLEDILERVQEAGRHLLEVDKTRQLSGVTLGTFGGVSWDNAPTQQKNWRSCMNEAFQQLQATGTGILITIDEVDPDLPEMEEFITTFQHFVMEDKKVALLMAGLPYNVSKLLSGKSTSFLRRANRYDLGSIPNYEVTEAFRLTVEEGGKKIDDDALNMATKAIKGFPYMFQLLGYRAWNASGSKAELSTQDVKDGADRASKELESRIFDATLSELSKADLAFVKAIAQDGESSTREAVMKRLNKPSGHISTYKRRLLEAGVIEEPRPGVFNFALPGFGAYVRKTLE